MNQSVCSEDVYQKWLLRRINYAAIRATGAHAPEPFLHLMTHHGNTKQEVQRVLRKKLWKGQTHCRGHAFYNWPLEVKDNLDFRFMNHPMEKYCMVNGEMKFREEVETCRGPSTGVMTYSPNFTTVLQGTTWGMTKEVLRCPLSHTHETPQTWTLKDKCPDFLPCPRRIDSHGYRQRQY